ncbi:ParB/RepB/Spo0J family partition protein [Streptomyces clavifer]|uniref:ParB/RepB/Spo0J family partition protein n=1 Tax=Streptomyces clavifer TaxID=68188 RepID=UPI002E80B358|nr:ParB/RepB/Spo0J family partition protein [Streptomyces clavifer]WRY79979.1 ParB/RepB/Spo0J family partition protein [Streptomyces clavifer]WRY86339.1 ParB/RepB/Spo0J family partition protein [Streptomyces clavifer]WUC32394.1 ParB/RepB/Spo0J family partition protein [Streptomyces clavifer]
MSKAKNLGAGASFAQARPISARRAAIGAATEAHTDGVPDPTELPLGVISQNPDNPREELRDLDGLAESIREIGLVNAITIASVEAYLSERPDRAEDLDEGARYIVIDGHRRLEAARLAGAPRIRVSVDNTLVSTDESLLEAAFVANVHRDDMNPLEQAQALRKLVKFYGSQSRAAKRLGIGQSTISSKLSILDIDPELQADLVAGRRTIEHVRNLSKLPPEEQRQKADRRAAAGSEQKSSTVHSGGEEQGFVLARPEPPTPLQITPPAQAELSRRDSPASQTREDAVPEELPTQRTEPASQQAETTQPAHRESVSVPVGTAANIKMPWHDANAVAELVLRKMDSEQQQVLLARLLAVHGQAAGH